MSECKDLVSFSGLIHAAFEIVDNEADNFDELLVRTIKSQHFEKSLRKALEAQAKTFIAEKRGLNGAAGSEKSLSGEEATKVFTTIVEKTLSNTQDSGLKAYKNKVKNSSSVKKLERDVKQFGRELKCSVDDTSLGIWVSDNQAWLVVVGTVAAVGAVLGGAAAMYHFRQGDDFANLAVKVLPEFKTKVLGTIELKASITNFKPSERTIGVQLGAEAKWSKVKVTLDVSGLAVEKSLGLGAKVKVIIPIDKNNTLIGGATANAKQLSLGGPATATESDVKLNLVLQHKGDGFSVQLGATLGVQSTMDSGTTTTYGVTGGIAIPF